MKTIFLVVVMLLGLFAAKNIIREKNKVSENTSRFEGIMEKEDLKDKLTPEQFHVTQENGTERPFQNQYWNNKHPGLYVDVVSGEPLFSSKDKFDSGTGWPSFTKPLNASNIIENVDDSLFVARTEVRSKTANSHLGHVFTDGPAPTGMRYCINSAALRFIPVESLKEDGYDEFASQFNEEDKGAK